MENPTDIYNNSRVFANSFYDDWTDEIKQTVVSRLTLPISGMDIDELLKLGERGEYSYSGNLGGATFLEEDLPTQIQEVLAPFKQDLKPEVIREYAGKKKTLTPYIVGHIESGQCVVPHVDPTREMILIMQLGHPGTEMAPLEIYHNNQIIYVDNNAICLYAVNTKQIHGVMNTYFPSRYTFQVSMGITYKEFVQKYRTYIV